MEGYGCRWRACPQTGELLLQAGATVAGFRCLVLGLVWASHVRLSVESNRKESLRAFLSSPCRERRLANNCCDSGGGRCIVFLLRWLGVGQAALRKLPFVAGPERRWLMAWAARVVISSPGSSRMRGLLTAKASGPV